MHKRYVRIFSQGFYNIFAHHIIQEVMKPPKNDTQNRKSKDYGGIKNSLRKSSDRCLNASVTPSAMAVLCMKTNSPLCCSRARRTHRRTSKSAGAPNKIGGNDRNGTHAESASLHLFAAPSAHTGASPFNFDSTRGG